ncbi:MAG: adenylate/guanylate cyclase domain-containing protein [Pirellulales bacterium]|nr:adenylate/guanylate cyclase domain-containing protein [Pirellulales bacterium]
MTSSGAEPESVEAPPFPVLFYHQRRRVFATTLDAPLEIGRQREGEPDPAARIDQSSRGRVIVAPLADVEVSRAHIGLELAEKGRVRVANLSASQPVKISPQEFLGPGESALLEPPFLLQFGDYAARVDPPVEDDDLQLEGLPERTVPPGHGQVEPASLARMGRESFTEASLLQWLETVLHVFESAANSHDFPEQAARAVVKIVGLDAAAMLNRQPTGRWQVEAVHGPDPTAAGQAWDPSYTLLDAVANERRTFRHVPVFAGVTPKSLQNVAALVAAPILDGTGEVIGALYGDRRSGGSQAGSPQISEFEAKLVELLANGVAAGLARVKEEQAAAAARVQFEQFFTPQLAAQLQRDPQLLEGRDARVTVLFADIRGFSHVSERLGPEGTMTWIHDTMSTLSECVLQHDGVLVDFIGDELMAMWGAPLAQADHARLACLAAGDMLAALPAINARWRDVLGSSVRLGIGLNSGVARVGNTGSRQKFKYGPLGDAVNVASRVQGATKYLGAECLITGDTLAALPASVVTRRLARVRVVNIEQPIDLFEIVVAPPANWERRCTRYNEALEALEREEIDRAVECAERLAADFIDDTASAALARRARDAQAQRQSDATSDTSVWRLPGK